MAKHLVPNNFDSIAQVKELYGTPLPKPHDWKLMSKGIVGQIHGLHTCHGTAVATNGILIAILRGTDIIIGHSEWFVPDEVQPDTIFTPRTSSKASTMPRENIFAGFSLD